MSISLYQGHLILCLDFNQTTELTMRPSCILNLDMLLWIIVGKEFSKQGIGKKKKASLQRYTYFLSIKILMSKIWGASDMAYAIKVHVSNVGGLGLVLQQMTSPGAIFGFPSRSSNICTHTKNPQLELQDQTLPNKSTKQWAMVCFLVRRVFTRQGQSYNQPVIICQPSWLSNMIVRTA